jgi:hypothetical protein
MLLGGADRNNDASRTLQIGFHFWPSAKRKLHERAANNVATILTHQKIPLQEKGSDILTIFLASRSIQLLS